MLRSVNDLREQLRHLYSAKAGKPAIVDVPNLKFIMIDGTGDPSSAGFQAAVQALYAIAFSAKFSLKKTGKGAFRVMPLEGLWFGDEAPKLSFAELMQRKAEWTWTLLIAQPEEVDRRVFRAVVKDLAERGKPDVERVRLQTFKEGRSVQIMHVGPYANEFATIEKLHAFAKDARLELRGRHHEIYLGDPRRCAPEKLRTILRNPVR